MDIFGLIKAWYEYKAENPKITPTHTDLLFYIIDLNNRLAWKEVFGLPSVETANFLGISYKTFFKVFNELVSLKLIKVVKKSKNQYAASQISIEPLWKNLLGQGNSTYKAFIIAQQKQVNSELYVDIHIKHKNILNKLNIKEKECEALKKEIEILNKKLKENNINNKQVDENVTGYDTVTLNFSKISKETWYTWISYKKTQFKETYKTQQSEQTALNSLIKLSNDNNETALQIINQSITNLWKGLFELKESRLQPSKSNFTPVSNPIPFDILNRVNVIR